MDVRKMIVEIEAAAERTGWDAPSVVFAVDGGRLVPLEVGGDPVVLLHGLAERGVVLPAVLVLAHGWGVMCRHDAAKLPEWLLLDDEVREHWETVQATVPPHDMGPFAQQFRVMLYVDGESLVAMTRKRGNAPFWSGQQEGPMIDAARSVVVATG